jgi:hypothetical protein
LTLKVRVTSPYLLQYKLSDFNYMLSEPYVSKLLTNVINTVPLYARVLTLSFSGHYYKTFLDVIYVTIGVFPYDFDRGYANSDVNTPKKFYNIGHWSYICR